MLQANELTHPKRSSAPGNYERVLEYLADHSKDNLILDCPCGEGALAKHILAAGFRRLEVADFNPSLFKLAAPKAAFADLNTTLPWPDRHFGVVICCDGMSDIQYQQHALTEFHRILQPGGSVIIAMPNILAIRSRLRFLLTGFYAKFRGPLDEVNGQSTVRPIPFWEMRYMLVRAGFTITQTKANRFKLGEMLCMPLAAIAWLFARVTLARSRLKAGYSPFAGEVMRSNNSWSVLFGESLIIQAVKRT